MIKDKQKIYLYFGIILLLLCFGLVSFSVEQNIFRNYDYYSMVSLQKNIPRFLDKPFSVLSLAASSEVSLFIIISIGFAVLIRKRHIFLGLLMYFFIYFIELFGKFIIFHPKPPGFFSRYSLDFHMPSSFFVDTHSSYPSGHMARTAFFAVCVFIMLHNRKMEGRIKILIYIISGLYLLAMFTSRIYLGEHWFSDTLGGLLLGTAASLLAFAFW